MKNKILIDLKYEDNFVETIKLLNENNYKL